MANRTNGRAGAVARLACAAIVLGILGAGSVPLWAADDALPPPGAAADDAAVTYGPPDAAARAFTAAELRELVARIALFPDDLVALILPASTYPLQVVQAARYLDAVRSDPALRPDDEWDDSIVALLNYPEIIELMDGDLRWTARLGEAVIAWQADVIAAVGEFRADAYAAGNLASDERQVVDVDDGVVSVRPADPQSVYVPYYEPALAVVPQYERVIHYYPQAYPVYYHPYVHPYDHRPLYSHFWGVSSLFSIVWRSGHLGIRHHDHFSRHHFKHRHRGHHYRDGRHHRRARSFAFGGRPGVRGSGRGTGFRQQARGGQVAGAVNRGGARVAGVPRRPVNGIAAPTNNTAAASRRGNGRRAAAATAGAEQQRPNRTALAPRANPNRGTRNEGRPNERSATAGNATAEQIAGQLRAGARPASRAGTREAVPGGAGRATARARPNSSRVGNSRRVISPPTVARSAAPGNATAAQIAGQLRAGVRPASRSGARAAVTGGTGQATARARSKLNQAGNNRQALRTPTVARSAAGRSNARARPNAGRSNAPASRTVTAPTVRRKPAATRRAPGQSTVAARVAGQFRAGVRPRVDAAAPARAGTRAQSGSRTTASNSGNGFGARAARSQGRSSVRSSAQSGGRSRSVTAPRRAQRSTGGFATRQSFR